MTYQTLDYYFPLFVFAYGFLMTAILNTHWALELADQKLPPQLSAQFKSHRMLGLVCLIVGGLWSLQNLLLAPAP